MKIIRFEDIRQDWYHSNQLLPRLLRNGRKQNGEVAFLGFPRQWIPFFEYYGVAWEACSEPPCHIPLISELSDDQLAAYCKSAEQSGTLRTFVESVSVLDPLLADLLYIVDHSTKDFVLPPSMATLLDGEKTIRLTSWQSYGRPEVIAFEAQVDRFRRTKSTAVLLPCSRRRPYRTSRTHKRIWRALGRVGCRPEDVDQIVVTSLGVIPEELWEHPVVMSYDAGVPDIYRILRIARRFFERNRYTHVVDCLQFAPYSDVFSILRLERIVRGLSRGPVRHSRQFFIKA